MTVTSKLPDWCLQSIEESNKPMSLDEIRAKFVDKFPFKAKKVLGCGAGKVFNLIKTEKAGDESICKCGQWWVCISSGGYVSDECNCSENSPNWGPHSKAWLYQG